MAYNWRNKNILIAEDDYLSCKILQSYLSPTKARIFWAHNGKEAINIFKETPNLDLIIMDIRMPVLNGFEATKKIREHNKQLPILAHSAFYYDEFDGLCIDAGCNACVAKPSSNTELLQSADQLMEYEIAEQ